MDSSRSLLPANGEIAPGAAYCLACPWAVLDWTDQADPARVAVEHRATTRHPVCWRRPGPARPRPARPGPARPARRGRGRARFERGRRVAVAGAARVAAGLLAVVAALSAGDGPFSVPAGAGWGRAAEAAEVERGSGPYWRALDRQR